jgi:hypothetical protein
MPDVPDRASAGARRRPAAAWLLLVPLLLVVYPPLYNRTDPQLLGIPFFYWYQLAVIPVSVLLTTIVYRAGRRDRGAVR